MSVRSTSKSSYRLLHEEGKIGAMQSLVYMSIQLMGECTDSMLAQYMEFEDLNKVRPRRNELVELGLVEGFKKSECPISHRTVYWWRII